MSRSALYRGGYIDIYLSGSSAEEQAERPRESLMSRWATRLLHKLLCDGKTKGTVISGLQIWSDCGALRGGEITQDKEAADYDGWSWSWSWWWCWWRVGWGRWEQQAALKPSLT